MTSLPENNVFFAAFLHLWVYRTYKISKSQESQAVRVELLQQLQELQGAHSVQMQEDPPEFGLRKETSAAEGINDGRIEGGRKWRKNK